MPNIYSNHIISSSQIYQFLLSIFPQRNLTFLFWHFRNQGKLNFKFIKKIVECTAAPIHTHNYMKLYHTRRKTKYLDTRAARFPKAGNRRPRRFGTSRNWPAGNMPEANDRNQPRTRSRRTLKWVSKWQSRSSLVARPVARINIYTSVTLSLTKLAFTYASNIVRWVWKCPRHSGTMLSAVAVLAPGRLEYDRDRGPSRAWFPSYIGSRQLLHYSRWPMASRTDEVPIVVLRRRNPRPISKMFQLFGDNVDRIGSQNDYK